MKKTLLILPLLVLTLIGTDLYSQTISERRAVSAFAEINSSSPSITIRWMSSSDAISYEVYRRNLNDNLWGTVKATKSPADTFYLDDDISVGQVYEYAIRKRTNFQEPLTSNTSVKLSGFGYVSAAIQKPAVGDRGVMWVLVAKNIQDSLASEVAILVNDLAADGWEVYSEVIAAASGVPEVKTLIGEKRSSTGCDALYLLGHLPVPYSGFYCGKGGQYSTPPDGHTNNHCGAWPADVYYATPGGGWTDKDSITINSQNRGVNNIGDGVFDNIRIPSKVEMEIGRVDFNDMPAFDKTEIQLTKQYLDKAHKYKMAQTQYIRKGVVENNFAGAGEGFSSGALRDFVAILGKGSVVHDDIFDASRKENYLLAYGCGGGSFTSCSGVGRTDSFKVNNAGIFNHLFGSYFGDWDVTNNFMRACIATEKLGLTCMWSGRPKWATHTLAMGETYGKINQRSHNNWQSYDGNYYQNGTHMALMGDPSLRHDMLVPPTGLSLLANGDKTAVDVTWTASTESSVTGYNVYRSHKSHGKFVLLTSVPISALTFTDNTPYDGTNHYMVKTVKETTTGSGTYINQSLGTIAEINGMTGTVTSTPSIASLAVKVYPTLADRTLFLETTSNSDYQIISSLGAILQQGTTMGDRTTINIAELQNGLYFLKVNNSTHRFVKM